MPEVAPGVEIRSRAQAEAWAAGRLAPAERVADGVWALCVPMPGPGLPFTIAYALTGDDGVHLIDAGWDDDESLAALTAGLAESGHTLGDVRTVVATHFHPDHLGLSGRLRALAGARVVLSATDHTILTQAAARETPEAHEADLRTWGVPRERWAGLPARGRDTLAHSTGEPDIALADGDVLRLAGHTLRVLATPGHSGGHICLIDDERRLLYSGDHVLPGINPGVGIGALPDADPLADYLDSLDRLGPYDDYDVLPGHEYRFTGLAARRAQIAAHHLRRTAEVAALLSELGDAPVWEYARRLTWSHGWEGLHGFHLLSALRQTALHRDFVRSGHADRYLSR